ncbi:MAG: PmoA family protein [Planctomycetales bacterium]|nr:PmoA family protein [Planctomycetales bacterium]
MIGVPCVAADVKIVQSEGKATVTIDGKLFTEYVFTGHSKPILYPILGPHQTPMTRNYPMQEGVDNEAKDHPHHKSLWFTHDDVNKVRFWMEYPGGKDQAPGKIIQQSMKVDGNRIVTQNNWTASDGKVVCTDERVVSFGANDVGRYIDYQVTLKASNGQVVIGDTKEGTMGIRTNPLLRLQADEKRGNHTAKGQAVNSEGVEGTAIWGKRAKWVDYWAPVEGHTVGVAIFDHPTNPRHPTWWHARAYGLVAANPFGISDFEKKPEGTGNMTLKPGDEVTFRYRFLFHEGDVKQADIPAQYDAFAGKSASK